METPAVEVPVTEVKMNLYEFITPSDPITFMADDDKVAFVCAVYLGRGKAGCHRCDNDVDINSMLFLMDEKAIDETIQKELGMDIKAFWEQNKKRIKDCFSSFAYGSVEDRRTYDDAVSAITDTDKLKEFKSKHEDRNRTSMSQWVKGAWQVADGIKL